MANFYDFKPFVRKWEGNKPVGNIDGAICTKWGVTLATYRTYCKQRGLPTPNCPALFQMTEKQWDEICKGMFWDYYGCDQMNDTAIACLIADWGWASGTATIMRKVTSLLGVPANKGALVKAVNNQMPTELFKKIWQARANDFYRIAQKPSKRKFYNGWMNRLNNLAATFKPGERFEKHSSSDPNYFAQNDATAQKKNVNPFAAGGNQNTQRAISARLNPANASQGSKKQGVSQFFNFLRTGNLMDLLQ